ncbi:hypothetical protein L1987_23453 [Smallanthus sonchifolius]|uniref:Uncharacterized protein n=1 Tax=Smallanthus sonchifolius TaxID=185202 RepID=A0ACB9IIK4_9ASTR|nr:hypothetical protein L1987_23453 [Smallanthus sonchifolius]
MMSRKGKEPVKTRVTTLEHPTSLVQAPIDEDLINMITEATVGVISQLRTHVANLKVNEKSFKKGLMFKLKQSIYQTVLILKGLRERENMGEGPSGINVGEGTSGQLPVNIEDEEKENEEEKKEEKEKDENQVDVDKDKDDDEDRGDTGLGGSDGSDSTFSDDDNDEETFVGNPSTDQGSKPLYTTVEGQVLEDIEEGDNIDDPIDVSSPLYKSDYEQIPPAEASKPRIDITEWFKAFEPKNLRSFKILLNKKENLL